MTEHGWQVDFYPFEDDALHEILYSPGRQVAKAAGIVSCYLKQARRVLGGIECDGLFIYREAALIGPAFLERLAKRLRVPIIYDIDDPVFLPYRSPVNGWMSMLKFSRKTHSLFQMADRVTAINSLIGDYARKYNNAVSVVPNFVDTDVYRPAEDRADAPAKIVWTGSVSTLRNLDKIAEPLRQLQAKYGVEVRVIANGETQIEGVKLDQRWWSPEVEVTSLQECDIGIVPLLDIDWNPWKFFLKTVQYMAVGLPVVARRVGSNSEVIDDGVNGFLVESDEEWVARLSQLFEDAPLRRKMGEAAREKAVREYSIESQMPRVAQIFQEVYGGEN